MNFLVLVHVYEVTGSSIASSLVWISYALPVIIIGPLLATYVELHDKKRMMLYANIMQATIIFLFAVFFDFNFYLAYIVVILYSTLDQIYVPAETASIPFVVKRGNLARANGLFFLTAQAAAVLGFGLAGLVIKILGFSDTLVIAGVLLVLAAISVLNLPQLRPKTKSHFKTTRYKLKEIIEKTLQGFTFIIEHKKILFPIILLVLLQVYLVIFIVNLPAIGAELIKTESAYVGLLTVIPIGIGAILGTYFVPKILKRYSRKSTVVLHAMLAASLVMIVGPAVSILTDFWLARAIMIIAFGIVGFAFVSIIVPSITYLQTHTPDQFMARVFGNFWFAAYLATIFPTLFSASVTDFLGADVMLIFMGFILLAIYVYSKTSLDKLISRL